MVLGSLKHLIMKMKDVRPYICGGLCIAYINQKVSV